MKLFNIVLLVLAMCICTPTYGEDENSLYYDPKYIVDSHLKRNSQAYRHREQVEAIEDIAKAEKDRVWQGYWNKELEKYDRNRWK